MRKIIKQVAGIDVAQKELVVSLGRMYDDWAPELYAHKTFANTQKGFTRPKPIFQSFEKLHSHCRTLTTLPFD